MSEPSEKRRRCLHDDLLEALQCHTQLPPPLRAAVPVPVASPEDRGPQLLDHLRHHSAFFWPWPEPDYERFRAAMRSKEIRPCGDEDLGRSWEQGKQFVADRKVAYGLKLKAAKSEHWIAQDLRKRFLHLQMLFKWILAAMLTPNEAMQREELAEKVLHGRESWCNSSLRHAFYPGAGGTCGEHCDWSVLTAQQSTGPGFRVRRDGVLQELLPRPGYLLVYAGQCLEILTNGDVKALAHKVHMGGGCDRQSHIVFMQPDDETELRAMARYRRGASKAKQYGTLHRRKVASAHGS